MLKSRKRLAGDVMKCSPKRVWLDPDRLEDIEKAITKYDIRGLIKEKAIKEKPARSPSRGRARDRLMQKRKGRRKGEGSRKGKRTARLTKKRAWINKVRIMREFLKDLKEKEMLSAAEYRMLYVKVKGGFFRSKRHIKMYIEEQDIIKRSK
ncbi:50S ribosomal protein L19e [Candidatus Woesearchaeota archaeon]|nr:50S ribosomal protein L19e [Candidatus Woesearchaeota archaeon]